MGVLDIIAKTAFFDGVSEESLAALARVCRPRATERRDILFREAEVGEAVYIVAAGEVRLFRTSEDGRETVIRICGPGELFGEVVLFEAELYPVTAEVLRPGLVYRLPCQEFRLLLDIPFFRDDFIVVLMRKQRYLVNKVQQLAAADVEERLLSFLEDRFGRVPRIEIELSKKEVASAISALPETLSRTLKRLKRDGVLDWSGRVIEVSPEVWSSRAR